MTTKKKGSKPTPAERAETNAQRIVDEVGSAVVAGRLRESVKTAGPGPKSDAPTKQQEDEN